jgi:hypothetical protein
MNKLTDWNNYLRRGRLAVVLLAVIFSIPALRAQPTEQTVQSRFLFIFDTSKSMKPRFEAVEKALDIMLATSLSGQLHSGDSMGVWTFGQSLRTKGFPLQSWNPDDAVNIASNLVKFVGKQSYAKSTRFEALQPTLNRVVQNSERLTVLIFCDGEGKVSGTPYDDAINQALQEKLAEQKKAHQPFVIILRSQLGQYVGCTLGLPPALMNYPQFPPLPLPPPPPAPKPTYTPPAPVVVGQPLIIIGKKPSASVPPPVTNAPPAAVPEKAAAPFPKTAPSVPTNTTATATATNPVVAKMVDMSPMNPPPPLSQSSVSGGPGYRLIGWGLLAVAVALGLILGVRPRRSETSLITHSMKERK